VLFWIALEHEHNPKLKAKFTFLSELQDTHMAVHFQIKTPLGRFIFSMNTMWNLARAKPLEPLVKESLTNLNFLNMGGNG